MDVQRLRVPSSAVVRDHEPACEGLVAAVLVDQGCQLARHFGEPAEAELHGGPRGDDTASPLREGAPDPPCPQAGQAGQRLLPEAFGFLEQRRRPCVVALGRQRSGPVGEPEEAVPVHGLGVGDQGVRVGAMGDGRGRRTRCRGPDRPADAGHIGVDVLPSACRRVVPEPVDEGVQGYGAAHVEGQGSHEQLLLDGTETEPALRETEADGAENMDLHQRSSRRHTRSRTAQTAQDDTSSPGKPDSHRTVGRIFVLYPGAVAGRPPLICVDGTRRCPSRARIRPRGRRE